VGVPNSSVGHVVLLSGYSTQIGGEKEGKEKRKHSKNSHVLIWYLRHTHQLDGDVAFLKGATCTTD
jgi:hypothetical protein